GLATGISSDGKNIVGTGTNPAGQNEIWIAHLGTPIAPGDLTGDGIVNIDDLLALLSDWGSCPAPSTVCPADLDGDGSVNINDLLMLINNWG
ncbi:MAG: dockerin type I domain-containing protein, partial [Phycisphaerales bacterium]|nr:dockerin type I domain-containing protein [Phycisphaerales bacterium]